MTVAELIDALKSFRQDLPVCYQKYSEQCVLRIEDLAVEHLQPAREDGWVHNSRPDKPRQEYLVLPGN